jgi:D-alanine-D-alanine ligase
MDAAPAFIAAVPVGRLKVWVLAPSILSDDANIDYYYDFSQSIAEYTRVFAELNINWVWQEVTLDSYTAIIEKIVAEKRSGTNVPLVLNLCDGDEVNGAPGVSVVKLLEEKGLVYTGSDEYFYRVTTSKIPMKQAFDAAAVPNAAWATILSREQDTSDIVATLGSPLIVKPAVSGGSMGVGTKNVVHDTAELNEQLQRMFDGYRGWNLAADGIIAESFIKGREFTVLIVGSYKHPEECRVYEPVERVFHPSLPDDERFLSFDRLWEIYEDETPMPGEENFYEYELPADISLREKIKQLSLDAYIAVKGTGYTRVDLRMDQHTGELVVLEVNAQCGLSEDEDYTSIGAILRVSNASFTGLVVEIINDAFRRKIPQPVMINESAGATVVPLSAGRAPRKKIK